MGLRILGPLELVAGRRSFRIGGPREHIVLATLALNANRVTSVEQLMSAVWGEYPPSTARGQIQGCISGLRKLFGDAGLPDAIKTRASGYLLSLADEELDSEQFTKQVAQAHRQAADRQLGAAAATLRAALELWTGPALDGVQSEAVQRRAALLEDARVAAVEERMRLELELGRHEEITGELRSLLDEHPLRERFYAYLALALYRGGRQADALEVCRRARETLIAELGIEPGQELRDLERAILNGDPSLNAPAGPTAQPTVPEPPAGSSAPAPAAGQHRRLHRPDQPDRRGAPAAVRPHPVRRPGDRHRRAGRHRQVHPGAAHRARGRCGVPRRPPLRRPARSGGGGQHRRPAGPVPARARGDRPGHPGRQRRADGALPQPAGRPSAAARPRRRGQRGTGTAAAAGQPQLRRVDDQSQPAGALPGAYWISLDGFDRDTSMEFLATIVGRERLEAEPKAADELVAYCGGLPLALRIAGARLASRPHWRIAELARRLKNEVRRLDEFSHHGLELRSSIGLSYRSLPEQAKRLFRLLAMVQSADFPAWSAAALLDIDLIDAEETLERLVDVQMLDMLRCPARGTRYRFHDLIRVYAQERLTATETETEQREALGPAARRLAGPGRTGAPPRVRRRLHHPARQRAAYPGRRVGRRRADAQPDGLAGERARRPGGRHPAGRRRRDGRTLLGPGAHLR